MKRHFVRWIAGFFEKDRGRFLSLLAISVLAPIKMSYKRDRNRYRRLYERYDIDVGRIDLLINMIGDRL